MQRDARTFLCDMRDAADSIHGYVQGCDFDGCLAKRLLHAGVEREFVTIGEAVSHLARIAPDIAARISDARRIIGRSSEGSRRVGWFERAGAYGEAVRGRCSDRGGGSRSGIRRRLGDELADPCLSRLNMRCFQLRDHWSSSGGGSSANRLI